MSLITKKQAYVAARLLFILPGLAIGVLLYGWANSPSSQSIKVGDQTGTSDNQVDTRLKTLSTDYFTVQLPANFKTQTNGLPGSSQLVQILSYEPYSGGVQVGIVSNILPSGGLSGVADYNYRKTKAAEYIPISLPSGNASTRALFRHYDQSELSAYLVNGSRYASVTVSGPPEQSTILQKRLEETLQTWQWQ